MVSVKKDRMIDVKKRLFCIITALAAAGAVWYLLWHSGVLLPRWIAWNSTTASALSGQYEIVLNAKSVRVLHENAVIWTSPDGVKVSDILSCDIDRDGEEELILLCWKRGRYGEYRPFWVDKDERKWSQHIFVYDYAPNTAASADSHREIRPKWMSSHIGLAVKTMTWDAGTARAGSLLLTDLDGKITGFVWDSWGFVKEDTQASFLVFGDNLIHEPIYRYGLYREESFGFLFENVKDMIAKSDVAVIQQETPLTDNPSLYGDYPRFGTPVNVGQAIVDAGFDIVTCASNHALDRGVEGVNFTKRFFDSGGTICLGIQSEEEADYQPYQMLVRNGIRFALLNYTYGTNGNPLPDAQPYLVHLLDKEEQIREDLAKAEAEADFVIVFVHWGTEYAEQIDEFQQRWARVFLDCGADAVIGTHPHALQPYEMLEDESGHEMLIYYSIGNFISAQPEQSCTKGGAAEFTVSLTSEGYRVTEYTLQPLTITWRRDGRYTVDS